MAINQKSWSIWERPKVKLSSVDVYLTDKNIVKMVDPTKPASSGGCLTYVPVSEIDGLEKPKDNGGMWIEIFNTTSYEQLTTNYKKFLKTKPNKQLMVTENIPLGLLVIPQE